MKKLFLIPFAFIAMMATSCQEYNTVDPNDNVEQPTETEGKHVKILFRTPSSANTRAMGAGMQDGQQFEFDMSSVILLQVDDEGSVIIEDDPQSGEPQLGGYFSFINLTTGTPQGDYVQYEQDIVLPSDLNKFVIWLNSGDGEPIDVNFTQGITSYEQDYGFASIGAIGQGDLSTATGTGTFADPVIVSVTIAPKMARIQVENDLTNVKTLQAVVESSQERSAATTWDITGDYDAAEEALYEKLATQLGLTLQTASRVIKEDALGNPLPEAEWKTVDTEFYPMLYTGLRIESIHVNRTYNNLISGTITQGMTTAEMKALMQRTYDHMVSPTPTHLTDPLVVKDITKPGQSWYDTYFFSSYSSYRDQGAKWGLFNTYDTDVEISDGSADVYPNLNAHSAAISTSSYNNGDHRWLLSPEGGVTEGESGAFVDDVTSIIADAQNDFVNGSLTQGQLYDTYERYWPRLLNPYMMSSFFQVDQYSTDPAPGTIGFNLYEQGTTTTSRDAAKEQQPHLIVRFSYEKKLIFDDEGNIVINPETGYPEYEAGPGSVTETPNPSDGGDGGTQMAPGGKAMSGSSISTKKTIKNLNIVAFEDTANPGQYPAFQGGNIYVLSLSDILSMILDENTPVTDQGYEDSEQTYTEMKVQIKNWKEVGVKPVI